MAGDLGRGVVAVEGVRPGDIPQPLGLESLGAQVRGSLHGATPSAQHLGLGQVCGPHATPVGVHRVPAHLPHVQGGLGQVCGSQAPTQGVGAVEVLTPSTLVKPLRDVAAVGVQAVHDGPVRDVPQDVALGTSQEPVIPDELLEAFIPRSVLAPSSTKPSWFLSTLRKKQSFFLPKSVDKKKSKFSFLPKEEPSEVLVQNLCSKTVPAVQEVAPLASELVRVQQEAAPPASEPVHVRQEGASSASRPVRVRQDLGGHPCA